MSLTCKGLRVQNLGMGWSQKLKAAAGAKKLSGAAIGRALGYSSTSANEWLRGETEPEFAILQPLCELLGIQVAWLFDDSLSDDLTGPGLLACNLFAQVLKERGPYNTMALLGGSTQTGRVVDRSDLADDPPRNYKGTNLPGGPVGEVAAVPGSGGHPPEIHLDKPPTGKHHPKSSPKGKR